MDTDKNLAWNIENCFKKAKEIESKLIRTQRRLQELQCQLDVLDQLGVEAWERKQKEQPGLPVKFKPKSGDKGSAPQLRSLELSGDCKAYFGKSGRDNLKLLRKSRAWDLWVHIKDHPGSHAIVFRPKAHLVTDEELQRVASRLVELSFGPRAHGLKGDGFEFLVSECRYVHPIKGDQLGRVTYSQAQTRRFVYNQ